MPFDSHFVMYSLGTEKQRDPQKKDVSIFHKLADFISRGIGSRHMGPYLENKVDGTRSSRNIVALAALCKWALSERRLT